MHEPSCETCRHDPRHDDLPVLTAWDLCRHPEATHSEFWEPAECPGWEPAKPTQPGLF